MRVLSIVAGIFLAIAGVVSVLLYLTFGVSTTAPRELQVSGLESEATVQFSQSGSALLDVTSVKDAAFSVGFTHAINHSWEMLLMRQASLGRLSEWFTQDAFPEDKLAKRLKLADHAKELYETSNLTPPHYFWRTRRE